MLSAVLWFDCAYARRGTRLLIRMDEQWNTEITPTTRALLHELGRHYAPFLVANAETLARGEDRLECTRALSHQPLAK